MKFLKFCVDHSTALLAVLTAAFNLLAAFGLSLTSEQVGAINTFAVAIIAVLSEAVRTASSTVVTAVVNGVVKAGAAAVQDTGSTALTALSPESGNVVPLVDVKPELLKAA